MIGEDFVLIGGFYKPGGGFDVATAKKFALDTSKTNADWRAIEDLPVTEGITHAAFVVVGTKFYMCGGYLGGHPGPHIPTCLMYNHAKAPGSGQWSSSPDLPDGRAGGGMMYDSETNSLVFAGGAERPDAEAGIPDAFDYTNTWSLDLGNVKGGWKDKTGISFEANHTSFVTATDSSGKQRHIFVGGQVGENERRGNVKDHYEFDVKNDIWVKLKDMPFTRGHDSSSTRALGCGYITGGTTNEFGKTNDVSFYNIEDDTWQKLGNLTTAINTPVCDISSNGGYLYCEAGSHKGS